MKLENYYKLSGGCHFLVSYIVVMLSTKNESLKLSPDCSGYTARSVEICSIAAVFERKAGQVYLKSPKVLLQKKSKIINELNIFN